MKIHELDAPANKDRKRVGRGISAGGGKTAGRGTKGQNSRTGHKLKLTFMGGQASLMQRVPKNKGFKSMRVPAQVVYTDQLNALAGKTADNKALAKVGLIGSEYSAVKVIVRGEVTGKVTLKTQGASKGAIEAITKAGGTFTQTDVPHFPVNEQKAADKKEAAETAATKEAK